MQEKRSFRIRSESFWGNIKIAGKVGDCEQLIYK